MKRKSQHRLMISLVAFGLVAGFIGYRLAPAQPWIFTHLTPGAYVAAFPDEASCRAARRAYGDRAGIPTDAPLTIAGGFVDFCSQHPDPDGAPFVRIDIVPEADAARSDQGQQPAATVAPKHRPPHRRRRRNRTCIVCEGGQV